MISQIKSFSSSDTYDFGKKLGSLLRGGEVIVLTSDLGGGKTTLTKGLAAGMGSKDTVSSPTFTVSQVYEGKDGLQLHHFDFYRLHDAGMVGLELAEVIGDPGVIAVIEWGDIVESVLPSNRIIIRLERQASGEEDRLITIEIPDTVSYLAEATA